MSVWLRVHSLAKLVEATERGDVPITVDQRKRLLYAKHMLGRAAEMQSKRSELLIAESVLALHDASEIVMQVVYEYHHIVARRLEFMEFWSKLPNESGLNLPKPPYYHQMQRLNDLRRGFKHHGTLPNPSVVRALDAEVRAFCSAICSMYLDTQLDELTLADLVENAAVCQHLKKAETLYGEGKVEDALVEIAEAYHGVWRSAETNGCIFVHDTPLGGRRLPAHAISTFEPQLITYLNLVLLGVDLPTYSLFRSFMPGVVRNMNGEISQVQWWHTPAVTPDQFSTVLSFVTELAISVQQRVRDDTVLFAT